MPPGVDEQSTLRLTGYGEQIRDGVPGNLFVQLRIRKHAELGRTGPGKYAVTRIALRPRIASILNAECAKGAEKNAKQLHPNRRLRVPPHLSEPSAVNNLTSLNRQQIPFCSSCSSCPNN